jgi:hypothetical protein
MPAAIARLDRALTDLVAARKTIFEEAPLESTARRSGQKSWRSTWPAWAAGVGLAMRRGPTAMEAPGGRRCYIARSMVTR